MYAHKQGKSGRVMRRPHALVLFLSDCWYFARQWSYGIKVQFPTRHQTRFIWRFARRRHKIKAKIMEKKQNDLHHLRETNKGE